VYLNPASIPKGNYTLGIKVGAGYRSNRMNLTNNKYQFNGGVESAAEHFSYISDGGQQYATENQAIMNTDLELSYITSQWDEEPFDPDGLCTVEFRIKNLQVDSLSVLSERYVRHRWNGTAFEVAPHVSSNPAELMYEVLTDADLNARTLNDAVIDAASIGAWATWCTANGKECNAYIESGAVEDALQILAEAGHAVLRRSETWGVYIDKSRSGETPVQVYSPRNSRGFQAAIEYQHHPHGFTVTFDDEDDDNQTSEITVFHDDYTANTATLIEARSGGGITNEEDIHAKFLQMLRAMRLRNTVYTWETAPEWMLSPRGSLVGMSSDVLDDIYGRARIVRVDRQDVSGITKIVAIAVDDELPMRGASGAIAVPDIFAPADIFDTIAVPDIFDTTGSTPTGLVIQKMNGVIVTGETSLGGRIKYIRFSTPLADDADILPGCMAYSGIVGQVYRELIVVNVTPGPNMTARITAVAAASGIFA